MLLTLSVETSGVLGIFGAGLGGGLYFDAETRELGPFLYVLGGGGLGAFGGSVIEFGVYRNREALKGRAVETGFTAGKVVAVSVNASLQRPTNDGGLAGIAAGVGFGGGFGAWALRSVTWMRDGRAHRRDASVATA